MTVAPFIKTLGGSLSPMNEIGADTLRSVEVGDFVLVEIRRPRNPRFHRKFFALINLIYQNQTIYTTIDDLLDAIKIYVGYYETLELRDGTKVARPKSIAFHKMDEAKFEQFVESVYQVVREKIIPGVSRDDLAREMQDLAA